jgi:hypothetical protein
LYEIARAICIEWSRDRIIFDDSAATAWRVECGSAADRRHELHRVLARILQMSYSLDSVLEISLRIGEAGREVMAR